MNVVKEIQRINELELKSGIYGGSGKGSWHEKYKNSAWVYLGGLPYDLSEGDIICVMSQWGEIEDINLVRDKSANKSMGFAFVKYEDQRSTILAVDNFNGMKLLGRTLRCDHVDKYKLPKEIREKEEEALEENPTIDVNIGPGHAYKGKDLANTFSIDRGQDVWSSSISSKKTKFKDYASDSGIIDNKDSNEHKHKKHKKEKKKKEKSQVKLNPKSTVADISTYSMISTLPSKDTTTITSRSDSELLEMQRILASQEEAQNQRQSLGNVSSSNISGSYASWRGKRDPAVSVSTDQERRKALQLEKNGGEPAPRRGEFEGFGGMKRRR